MSSNTKPIFSQPTTTSVKPLVNISGGSTGSGGLCGGGTAGVAVTHGNNTATFQAGAGFYRSQVSKPSYHIGFSHKF